MGLSVHATRGHYGHATQYLSGPHRTQMPCCIVGNCYVVRGARTPRLKVRCPIMCPCVTPAYLVTQTLWSSRYLLHIQVSSLYLHLTTPRHGYQCHDHCNHGDRRLHQLKSLKYQTNLNIFMMLFLISPSGSEYGLIWQEIWQIWSLNVSWSCVNCLRLVTL